MKKLPRVGSVLIATAMLFASVLLAPAAKAATTPFLSVSNASVVEGDSGNHQLSFNVTLSTPQTVPVTVSYFTYDDWEPYGYGRATSVAKPTVKGGDYVTKSGALTFNAGQVAKSVTITTTPDTVVEPSEHFGIVLYNPVGASLGDAYGTGTIIDDDATSGFWVAIGDASIREGNSKARTVDLVVSFSDPAPTSFTITTATESDSATGGAKVTTPGADYVNHAKTTVVSAGQRFKVIPISIAPNSLSEPTESFKVNLTTSYGTVFRAQGTVQIRDDDMAYARSGRVGGPPRVALMGDSITAGYSSTAKAELEALGYAVLPYGQPGSSILDASKCNGQWANQALATHDPDIVIFENIANYNWYPPCDPAITYNSPEFFAAWQQEAQRNTDILTSRGGKVFWMINYAVPPGDRYTAIQGINPIYASIAQHTPLAYAVDAWTAFGGETPNAALFVADQLHLSQSGEDLLTNLVVSAITQN